MKINIDLIKSFNPCKKGIELFESKYPKYNDSLVNLLLLEDVSYSDKAWLVTAVVDIKILQQWSVECAEYVVDNYNKVYPNDNRINDCIEKTKDYLDGICSLEELSAAQSAAQSAAWSAELAAESAAQSAAESAAESVVRSAAESVVRSAAWSEQRDINLSILIALLDNESTK